MSVALACILSFLYLKIFHITKYPITMINGGLTNFLSSNHQHIIGMIIGFMAASYFVFTPWLINLPTSMNQLLKNRSSILKSEPKKTTGIVESIQNLDNKTILAINYNQIQKEFEISNSAISKQVHLGDRVTVYYDPTNTMNSYLDFYDNTETTTVIQRKTLNVQNSTESLSKEAFFKLININPKLEASPSTFELKGEVHGDKFNGERVSLIHEFSNESLAILVPGKIFPCSISGSKENYNITLELGNQP